jgi:ELWxxDGT repeat protein
LTTACEDRLPPSLTPYLVSDINQSHQVLPLVRWLKSNPNGLTNVGGTLFFAATDAAHGRELWSSNGTAAGTSLVGDIFPGGTGSYPTVLTDVGGTLFFSANDGTHGRELWAVA